MTDAMRLNKIVPTKTVRVIYMVENQSKRKLEMYILPKKARKIPQMTMFE